MALISVTISGNAGPLKKSLDESETRLGKFGNGLKKFGIAAGAAFAAAGAAAVVMGKQLIAAGEAASTSNARIAQITESMGLFGTEAGKVTDRLVKLAEQTARNTGLDQNAIKLTQAKLLTFAELAKTADEVGGQFDRATQAAIDLAAAGFGEASQNAVQLGKALQDPIKGITALARSGVTFTEVEKARIETLVNSNQVSEAQVLILEAIEKQVGGTAEATANASDKIKVAFSQMQEALGQALLPVFERFSNFLIDTVFPIMQRIGERAIPVIRDAIANTVDTIKRIAIPIFETFRDRIHEVSVVVRDNEDAFRSMRNFLADFVAFVRDRVAPNFDKILGGSLALVATRDIPKLINGFLKVAGVVAEVARAITAMVNATIDAMEILVNGVLDGVNFMIRQLNRLPFIDIPEIADVDFNPARSSASTSRLPGFLGSVDRLPSPAMVTPSIPGISLPGESEGGGGGGGGGGRAGGGISGISTATGGLTLPTLEAYGTLESARLADLALLDVQPPVNITVNTVTADANLPNLIVEALQTYNYIYGPVEIEVAV